MTETTTVATRTAAEAAALEVADLEPKALAAAVRVGSTRLIDNVVLEGEPA